MSQSTTFCESERISQRGQFWCGGSGGHTTVATSSLNTWCIKTETGWILQSTIRGKGIWTNSEVRHRFLVIDFEHMKTILYLTDVVVLRHEGDTVNYEVLRSPTHAKVSRWRTVQTLWNPFWNCTGCKTRSRQSILVDVRQWWSLRKQFHWMVTIAPTFAQPSVNSSLWHLGDQTCNSPCNNYPHRSPTPGQRASEQWNSWYATHLSSSWTARNGLKRVAGTRSSQWRRLGWRVGNARVLREIIAMY